MNINTIHINTLGLIFDIIGAWFVAWEVVRQFHGKKIDKSPYLHDADDPPFETEEYKKWESSKYKRMKWGLAFLTIGFCMQISSNYLPLVNQINKINQPTIEKNAIILPPQKNIEEQAASPKIPTTAEMKNKAVNAK